MKKIKENKKKRVFIKIILLNSNKVKRTKNFGTSKLERMIKNKVNRSNGNYRSNQLKINHIKLKNREDFNKKNFTMISRKKKKKMKRKKLIIKNQEEVVEVGDEEDILGIKVKDIKAKGIKMKVIKVKEIRMKGGIINQLKDIKKKE